MPFRKSEFLFVSGEQTMFHRRGALGSIQRVCVTVPPLLQYHLRTTWRNSGCGDGHVSHTYHLFPLQNHVSRHRFTVAL